MQRDLWDLPTLGVCGLGHNVLFIQGSAAEGFDTLEIGDARNPGKVPVWWWPAERHPVRVAADPETWFRSAMFWYRVNHWEELAGSC